jgi:hypothetical protein
MSDIAAHLERKLRTFDSETAASVERLVRDALVLAEKAQAKTSSWPPGFWDQIREQWGSEPFERPSQGEFEQREEW